MQIVQYNLKMINPQTDAYINKSKESIEKDIFIQHLKFYQKSTKQSEKQLMLEKDLADFRLNIKSKMLSRWLSTHGIAVDSELLKQGISAITEQFNKTVREAKVVYIEQERKNS